MPGYWHLAYAACLPLQELAATLDEYLDQLGHFDAVFSRVWQPSRRIVDVSFRLDEAQEGLV